MESLKSKIQKINFKIWFMSLASVVLLFRQCKQTAAFHRYIQHTGGTPVDIYAHDKRQRSNYFRVGL